MQPTDLGEFELIRRFFSRAAPPRSESGVILGIGDDAALLKLPQGTDLVATVDTVVAGRHFPDGSDARSVGHRALAVNLSDLAAMGATPSWATLALTLPGADRHWLERFAAGLFDLADAHGVALVGGDTTRGPLTVTIQILGHVPHGTALRRSGARAGDLLAVSGTLGDVGRRPQVLAACRPRLLRRAQSMNSFVASTILVRGWSWAYAARGIATAAMDLSDGLVGDLPKLAQASGLHAHVSGRAAAAFGRHAGGGESAARRATGHWRPATTTNYCWPCRRRATRNCRRRRSD